MRTALVIDDNRQSADSLCQMLSFFNIEAHPAYGSRPAILALREQIPDLICLDINMPGVNGFEVLAYLRREPRLKGIPVIVVTAEDSPDILHQAEQLGAVTVVVKPSTLDSIEDALKLANLV